VASESGSTVSLTIRRVSHAQADQACDDGQTMQLTTTLGSPLASRNLLDAVDHKAITPLRQQQIASFHYLPAGYTSTKAVSSSVVGVDNAATSVLNPSLWAQAYNGPRPGQLIQLVQFQGRRTVSSGTPVALNGHVGYLQSGDKPGSGSWTLTWISGENTMTLLCSPTPGLPESEVLRIANGVRD
jgi:hypothetical protein